LQGLSPQPLARMTPPSTAPKRVNSRGLANTQGGDASGQQPRPECLEHLGCKSRRMGISAVDIFSFGLKADASLADGAQ